MPPENQNQTTHSLINKLLNTTSIPARSIGNVQCRNIVIVHLESSKRLFLLEIIFVCPLAAAVARERVRSTTKNSASLQKGVANIAIRELLEDEEACESLHLDNGAFVNLRKASELILVL